MDKQQAINLVKETFESHFEKGQFKKFVKNLLNQYEEAEITRTGNYVPDSFKGYVTKYERLGKYRDEEDHRIDILIVYLKREASIEHARSMQRNFIAGYLQGKYGTDADKDAALVAFVSPNSEDWRFSLVKLDVQLEATAKGGMKPIDVLTPARRWSFLVGRHEKSHTAQRQFQPILQEDVHNPTLIKLEEAFNIETVTKEFFGEYRRLFIWTKEELDKAVAANPRTIADFKNKGIDAVNLAKKLLGQIVFLYYLQKKGWFGVPRDAEWGEGAKNFLRELFMKKHGDYQNFFNDVLEHLFYDALRNDRSYNDYYYSRFNCRIPFLNGGLFDPMNNYDWVHTDIFLPNELFSNKNKTKGGDIGDGILDIFDRYNFTVKEDEPFEKEVAIDPELLGKAYEKFNAIRPDNYEEYLKALRSGKKGEETKFNKQYGVYYTPREIVHYMCQQSLVNYLYSELNPGVAYQNLGDNRLDMFGNAVKGGQLDMTVEHRPMAEISKEDIAILIQHGESLLEHEATVDAKSKETGTYSHQLPESIRKNALLIDEKLADIKVCDPAVGSGAFPVGMMSEIAKARHVLETFIKADKAVYDFKRECIENSLYGVDIDAGAVEITKLRLWLSLVVDEDDPQNIKPLPNLDYKIMCGDSLIGVEKNLFNHQLFAELEVLKPLYFNATNPNKKQEYKKKIDSLIDQIIDGHAQFDYEIHFSEVFHQKTGFDVVIANPPYVRQEKIKKLKSVLKDNYKCFDGRADIYVYFYERGINLLRKGGVLTFISSNKFFRAGYGENLRDFLSKNTQIQIIIDFGDLPIFEATTYPCILIAYHHKPNIQHEIVALNINTDNELNDFGAIVDNTTTKLSQKELGSPVWQLESGSIPSLLAKIRTIGKPLGKLVNGKIYAGIKTGLNEAFIVDSVTRSNLINEDRTSANIIKSFIKGKNINKWTCEVGKLYIIYTPHGTDINNYPAIKRHLKQYKTNLEKRALNQKWYELQQPQLAFTFEFEKTKIVYPNVSLGCRFALDIGSYLDMTTFCIASSDLVLLAILNSSLMNFYFSHLGIQRRGGYQEFKTQYVKELPIQTVISVQHRSSITKLINNIMAEKNRNAKADITNFEKEIDSLIYELYELTAEEIKIIEEKL